MADNNLGPKSNFIPEIVAGVKEAHSWKLGASSPLLEMEGQQYSLPPQQWLLQTVPQIIRAEYRSET